MMAIVSVLTDTDAIVDNYITSIKERLQSNSVLLNPFKSSFRTELVHYNETTLCQLNLMSIEPVYPNVTIFGWIAAITTYWIWGWSGWIIPFIIIGLLGVFWSKYFYTLIFWLGLRKEGYTGRFRILTADGALDKLLG